ncbi:hypothetical protein C8Q78DRAFT_627741 [Trametes maxima]|nr:hypothetical protein C8Q78DRAFT_627741 [Trametes maxima]
METAVVRSARDRRMDVSVIQAYICLRCGSGLGMTATSSICSAHPANGTEFSSPHSRSPTSDRRPRAAVYPQNFTCGNTRPQTRAVPAAPAASGWASGTHLRRSPMGQRTCVLTLDLAIVPRRRAITRSRCRGRRWKAWNTSAALMAHQTAQLGARLEDRHHHAARERGGSQAPLLRIQKLKHPPPPPPPSSVSRNPRERVNPGSGCAAPASAARRSGGAVGSAALRASRAMLRYMIRAHMLIHRILLLGPWEKQLVHWLLLRDVRAGER